MILSRFTAPIARIAAFAALVGGGAVTMAQAQNQVQFRGGGYVSNFSGCEDYGWNADTNMMIRARYSPGELAANDNRTSLSVYLPMGAENYSRRGSFGRNFRGVQGSFVWSGGGRIIPRPRVRVIAQNPQNISDTTGEIQMRLRVRNFGVLEGCMAEIGLVMTR
ncbi:MAG: hypothetical protein HLUCCA12_06140 [Rhodobacteraceae bacterium HLUCCA12]|nr:MAG: hypothetical protein HLUCCA12_06140 [Rhodobacteraceae bacterium HLUCCA12]